MNYSRWIYDVQYFRNMNATASMEMFWHMMIFVELDISPPPKKKMKAF